MKKIYILLIFGCAIAHQLTAQQLRIGKSMPVQSSLVLNNNRLMNDTLYPPSFSYPCDSAFVYYQLDAAPPIDTGYAFGNNIYGEHECAQRYLASGTVSEVLALIAYKNGTTDSVTAKIYSVAATGKPNLVLGTSHKIALSAISTTMLNSFTFTVPVAVTTKFFADITYPTLAGDTIAMASTYFGCAAPDSESYLKIGTTWNSICAWFTDTVGSDLVVLPVMATITGIAAPESNGVKLFGAYPNPAFEFTSIKYSLNTSANVSIAVFDLKGRIVKALPDEMQSSGSHDFAVDTKDLAAGNYYYTIRTDNSRITGKFSVNK